MKLPRCNAKYILPMIGRDRLWTPNTAKVFSWKNCNEARWSQDYNEYLPVFLNDQKQLRAESIRVNELGIPLTDWFVCLHVREEGFRHEPKFNSLRNGTLGNYIEGLRVITSRGGWVIRLGDPTMTPLPRLDRVVDYAHSPFRSPLMDMYLLRDCRFMMGTNSGPLDVSRLFQKRELLLNVCEWLYSWPMRKGDRIITKHIFSTSLGRFLSLREMLEGSPDRLYYLHAEKGTYALCENTVEEIRSTIQEFLDVTEDMPHSLLQVTANEVRKGQICRWLDDGLITQLDPIMPLAEAYRVVSRLGCQGTMAQCFLEANWEISSLENSPRIEQSGCAGIRI